MKWNVRKLASLSFIIISHMNNSLPRAEDYKNLQRILTAKFNLIQVFLSLYYYGKNWIMSLIHLFALHKKLAYYKNKM